MGNSHSRRSFKNSEEDIYTSVLSAARSGCIKATARFLARNPPPDLNHANNRGDTTLMLASHHGRKEIVAMLLAHPQPPDINQVNNNGDTALILASCSGYTALTYAYSKEIVAMLLGG